MRREEHSIFKGLSDLFKLLPFSLGCLSLNIGSFPLSGLRTAIKTIDPSPKPTAAVTAACFMVRSAKSTPSSKVVRNFRCKALGRGGHIPTASSFLPRRTRVVA